MGLIYKLTFSNGKVYVGMTTVSLQNRLYCHRYKSKKSNPKLPIHRAWKLHGEPKVDILLTCENSALAEQEKYFIKLHFSYGAAGYNSTPGGEDSPMKLPEIAAKVSALASTPERITQNKKLHLGSKRSLETRQLMSKMRKGMRAGIPKSQETRSKMSLARKGKPLLGRVGFKNTPETLIKMSKSAQKSWTEKRKDQASKFATKRDRNKKGTFK